MATIKGILFDKDGTLLDFFETWMPAYQAAARVAAGLAEDESLAEDMLRGTGLDPESGRLDPSSLLAGGTTAQICDAWADLAGILERSRFMERVRQTMDDYASRYPVPVADGLDLLFRDLADSGYILGIATMDSEVVARVTAEKLGLTECLTFIAGYDSGHGVKPDAGMVSGFCEAAGLLPQEVLVVGDTDRDIGMARNARAGLAVGVLTGATPAESMSRMADRVIGSVFDLPRILAD